MAIGLISTGESVEEWPLVLLEKGRLLEVGEEYQ